MHRLRRGIVRRNRWWMCHLRRIRFAYKKTCTIRQPNVACPSRALKRYYSLSKCASSAQTLPELVEMHFERSNITIACQMRLKRSDVAIACPNAPRALSRCYCLSKCASSAQTILLLVQMRLERWNVCLVNTNSHRIKKVIISI